MPSFVPSFRSHWIFAALLLSLAWTTPALAAPHGTFIPLPSVGLPPKGDVSQVAVNAKGEIFATIYGDGVYLSTDHGASFARLAPPNFGMTNDIANKEAMTMIVNALGEPIVGCREVGQERGQYLFRLDWAKRTWVAASIPAGHDIAVDGYDPTGSQSITVGTVSIAKQRRFPRHMTLDNRGVLWLGWAYSNGYLRSFDDGTTYEFTEVPKSTTGLTAGEIANMLYSFNFNPETGEYIYGTELVGYWHSTDGGNTWSPFDPTGTTVIGSHQNDLAIGFNKDQEPIFSNWGRTATDNSKGTVFTILTRDGDEQPAASGLKGWQFNKQSTFYQFNGGDALMRIVRVPSVGYNFISAYSSNYYENPVPDGGKQTVYLSTDGYHWEEADAKQPFVSPYCNSLCTDGTDVLVGGVGRVWKFAIAADNHLPKVKIAAPSCYVEPGTAVAAEGLATDADGDALTYAWHSRGAAAEFTDRGAASTMVSFPSLGDYVLTLTADDGHRSASTGMIVHVVSQIPAGGCPMLGSSSTGGGLAGSGGAAGDSGASSGGGTAGFSCAIAGSRRPGGLALALGLAAAALQQRRRGRAARRGPTLLRR